MIKVMMLRNVVMLVLLCYKIYCVCLHLLFRTPSKRKYHNATFLNLQYNKYFDDLRVLANSIYHLGLTHRI